MFRYDYVCEWCGTTTEGVVKSSSQKIYVCKKCGRIARRSIVGGCRTSHIATTDWFSGRTGPGGEWEDLCYNETVEIKGKEGLKRFCEDRGIFERKNGGPDRDRGPVVLLNG